MRLGNKCVSRSKTVLLGFVDSRPQPAKSVVYLRSQRKCLPSKLSHQDENEKNVTVAMQVSKKEKFII